MKEVKVKEAEVPEIHAKIIKLLADAGHSEELADRTNEETDHLKLDGLHKLINGGKDESQGSNQRA
jgi:hypothetical protein